MLRYLSVPRSEQIVSFEVQIMSKDKFQANGSSSTSGLGSFSSASRALERGWKLLRTFIIFQLFFSIHVVLKIGDHPRIFPNVIWNFSLIPSNYLHFRSNSGRHCMKIFWDVVSFTSILAC